LRIDSLSNGGQIVTWRSVPGRNYQVSATAALGTAFQPVSGTMTAFGPSTSFTNTTPIGVRQFYRVQVVP
jgi:hypothetical protein